MISTDKIELVIVAAAVYASIASGSMVLIGRRFVRVSENKNQAEAEYRYTITRLRDNGESIALIRGEPEERTGLDRSLKKVLLAWRQIATQNMKTTAVSQTSAYIAPVLPVILCAPKFLDGSMWLGEVMQAASAFTRSLQLARRQLSQDGRLDCLGTKSCFPDGGFGCVGRSRDV